MELLKINRRRFALAVIFAIAAVILLVPSALFASDGAAVAALDFPKICLFIAMPLMLAKVSSLIERVNQPAFKGRYVCQLS
ncbi:MAG: hypothetical protein HY884_07775 [Deltaproteobacteria bacterium]|nr:hypothetical protein [Deltaproteobacteria bacterium]